MSLESAAKKAVEFCMDVGDKDKVLVYGDKKSSDTEAMTKAIHEAALSRTQNVQLILKDESPKLTDERDVPYEDLRTALRDGGFTKVFLLTSPTEVPVSYTASASTIEAMKKGAVVASSPTLLKSSFENCVGLDDGDHGQMMEFAKKIGDILKDSEYLRIITQLGTNVVAKIDKENVIADTGEVYKQRLRLGPDIVSLGNLPGGEVFFPPIEVDTESRGKIVYDGMIAGVGVLEKPLELRIEGGKIVEGSIESEDGDAKKKFIEGCVKDGDKTICEVGFGINPKAEIIDNVLEAEKAFKTVHIAFGANDHFGGRIEDATGHRDGIITKPTVFVYEDKIALHGGKGRKIMDAGEFILS